jgi:hypothetical protein
VGETDCEREIMIYYCRAKDGTKYSSDGILFMLDYSDSPYQYNLRELRTNRLNIFERSIYELIPAFKPGDYINAAGYDCQVKEVFDNRIIAWYNDYVVVITNQFSPVPAPKVGDYYVVRPRNGEFNRFGGALGELVSIGDKYYTLDFLGWKEKVEFAIKDWYLVPATKDNVSGKWAKRLLK